LGAPNAYQSADADFVLTLEVDRKKIVEVMPALDFGSVSGTWVHPRTILTVEFPAGPLAVGGELITRYDTIRCVARMFRITRAFAARLGAGSTSPLHPLE
jgi:hypothetical protein